MRNNTPVRPLGGWNELNYFSFYIIAISLSFFWRKTKRYNMYKYSKGLNIPIKIARRVKRRPPTTTDGRHALQVASPLNSIFCYFFFPRWLSIFFLLFFILRVGSFLFSVFDLDFSTGSTLIIDSSIFTGAAVGCACRRLAPNPFYFLFPCRQSACSSFSRRRKKNRQLFLPSILCLLVHSINIYGFLRREWEKKKPYIIITYPRTMDLMRSVGCSKACMIY